MRKMFILGVVALAFAVSAVQAAEKTIGVTVLSREHVFFNIIEENLVNKAKELGYNTNVVDANMDVNRQIGQLDDFIIQGVDAVIVAPAAVAGLEPAIKRLAEAKIPVITIDNKINSTDPIILSSIMTDNYNGGFIAGEYTSKRLNGEGEVAVITYSEIFGCRERERGFKEAVAKTPGIKVVDVQNYAGSAEKAQQLVQDMLIKFPELKLIFCVGDPAVVGGIAAAKASGRTVDFIGFDGNPEAIDAIREGGMWVADSSQNPKMIGEKSVETLDAYWNGRSIENDVQIPCTMIDITNLP